jgi:hypothetical protein
MIKLDKIPKPIDKGWVALIITRAISILIASIAIMLLFGAISLLHDTNQFIADSHAHPNVAEDQPHGLDALFAGLGGGFGLMFLVISVALLMIALMMFIGTSVKLKKKAALAKQQSKNQVIAPGTQQTTTLPQIPQQNSSVSEAANHEAPDNNQQQSV